MSWQSKDNPNRVKLVHFKEAMDLAKKSKSEPGKISPKVGVVIVKDGEKIVSTCRNETGNGDHAEFIALTKTAKDARVFINADLITTLEPCTEQRHGKEKKPCIKWIKDYRIRKVWIGALDENPDIRGKSIRYLRDNEIAVDWFPDSFYPDVIHQNDKFFEHIKSKLPKIDDDEIVKRLDEVKSIIKSSISKMEVKENTATNPYYSEGLKKLGDTLQTCLNTVYGIDIKDAEDWRSFGLDIRSALNHWNSIYKANSDIGVPPFSLSLLIYRTALDINPSSISAMTGLSISYMRAGDLFKAEMLLKSAETHLKKENDGFEQISVAEGYYQLALETSESFWLIVPLAKSFKYASIPMLNMRRKGNPEGFKKLLTRGLMIDDDFASKTVINALKIIAKTLGKMRLKKASSVYYKKATDLSTKL